MFLSMNPRSSSMEPKMTSEGKFQCKADNKTFNSRADYDKHCSDAHVKRSGSKGW
jgi:hypothetical protein